MKAKTTLTDRAIKAAKPRASAYDLRDGVVPGFGVRVLPSAAKTFTLTARYPGSRNPTRRAVGRVGALTLEAARTKARGWLDLLTRGVDPATEVERERVEADRRRRDTVGAVIEAYIAQEVIGRDPANPRQRNHRKTIHALRDVLIPAFGALPVAALHQRDVAPFLESVAEIGTDRAMVRHGARKKLRRPTRPGKPAPETARALFVLLDVALRWAADHGGFGVEVSPLAHIKKTRRFGPATRRERILSDAETVALWRASAQIDAPHRQLYQLLLLTGSRLNEIARAQWNELDTKQRVWEIPAARMKGRNGVAREHVIPLTPGMLEIIASLPRGERGPYMFSVNGGKTPVVHNSKQKRLLDAAMLAELRAIDGDTVTLPPWRIHDVRRTTRSGLSRIGVAPDVAEAVIAHAIPGVRGIYDRYHRLPEKRAALEKWEAFLAALIEPTPRAGNVVRIGRRRAARR